MRQLMTYKAFISGCAGTALSVEEQAFFRAERPCGLILFERNCESPAQLQRLVAQFREAVDKDDGQVMVLIDQEGGRIQRLRPPHWRQLPPMRAIGDHHRKHPEEGVSLARYAGQLLALDLAGIGINVNCAPVLDVPTQGAHDIIGNRAFATDPQVVSLLGRALAEGLLAGGVLPVIKHLPGHGRATSDSHQELPVITASREEMARTDFVPFHALRDLPLGMTAHILLPGLDAHNPVSTSAHIIADVIRGEIGFQGLLMSDDLSMGALSGDVAARSRNVIRAGCDVILHCNGDMDEMRAVAAHCPALEGVARDRYRAALDRLAPPTPFDPATAEAALAAITDATQPAPPG